MGVADVESTMRPRSALAIALVPLAVAAFTACGDDRDDAPAAGAGTTVPPGDTLPPVSPTTEGPATSRYEVPTGADEVVISVGYEGGLMIQGAAFAQLPTLLVTGDGRAITPGMVTMQYPGPLKMPLMERTITPEAVQRLLARADELGLLADVEYSDEMTIADAPDTVVRITVEGVTYEHRAYALDMEAPRAEADEARANLSAFVAAATDLATTVGADELGTEEPYVAEQVLVQSYPVAGGELADSDTPPTVVDWPADSSIALTEASECAAIPAEEAEALFADATQATVFRDDGVIYRLGVVDQLPGRSC